MVAAGDIMGVLPNTLHPDGQVPILFSPKNATSTVDQTAGAFGVIATTGAIAFIYCIPNTSSSNNSASGSQDYWANMSYAIG